MGKYVPALFILCFAVLLVAAQPGALDLSFNPGTGANNSIRATAIQPDGQIIIGGLFTMYNGTAINHLARVNTDGSLDTSFHLGAGTDTAVWSVVLQTDGKILIGGQFSSYNGIASNGVARINTDGSFDSTFTVGTGLNDVCEALCIQADGRIVAGGDFTICNGDSCLRIVRLNIDGSVDTSFHSSNGANGPIATMAIEPNGTIMIGGSFTTYGSSYCARVGQLNADGSYNTSFNPVIGGTSSTVWGMAIQPNTDIVICGDFISYNASPMNYIARITNNGGIVASFDQQPAANNSVYRVALDSTGEMLVAGNFTTYNDSAAPHIALITAQGTLDTFFYPGAGPNGWTLGISFQADGKAILGGFFSSYNNISRNHIARIYNCLTPAPTPIEGSDSVLCQQTLTYTITPVAGAQSYEWSLPQGWTGSSDSSSITVTSSGQAGVISVVAFSDLCGYSLPQTLSVNAVQPPAVPICLVTVDTQSTHNIVIWDKPQTNLIDSFFVYREITTNNYAKIASVPYDSLSEYNDYAANPNTTSFRYKLSTLDVCGIESALSLYHNTINLQNLGSGNFQWTFYEIENSPNPVLSFNIYRDDSGNGNFLQIGLVPGTNSTFTDITYSSFPSAVYVVDVNWSISCDPTRSISTTRSNIRNGSGVSSLSNENASPGELYIYPNPSAKFVNVLLPASLGITGLKLYNTVGQVVWSGMPEETELSVLKQVNIENFASGLYTLLVETNMGKVWRKLIIE